MKTNLTATELSNILLAEQQMYEVREIHLRLRRVEAAAEHVMRHVGYTHFPKNGKPRIYVGDDWESLAIALEKLKEALES